MYLRKLLILGCFAFNVNSAELTPAERMMNAMGINQVLDQAKEMQEESSKKQVAMVMRQLRGTLSKIPPEKRKEVEVVFQKMMDEILDSWTTKEAINIYSQTWNDNYTEEEILNVVNKYEEPESQREIKTVMEASANLNEYVMNSYNQATEKAMAKAMPKMQKIIKDAIRENKSNKASKNDTKSSAF